jgi:predicted lipoprotein with Yx(FWY)xxD motif
MSVAALLGAAAVLAACGSGEEADTGGDADTSVVSSRTHPEFGTILVDSGGKTVYFADQEASGKVQCVDDCLEFWIPVDASELATEGVEDLGVVRRPDSDRDQLSYQGKPLYTFSMDEAEGDVTGDNLEDAFGGTTFTWHAVVIAGDGGASQPDSGGGGGYGY